MRPEVSAEMLLEKGTYMVLPLSLRPPDSELSTDAKTDAQHRNECNVYACARYM